MPERFSSVEVARALERIGFRKRSQRGSHTKYADRSGRTVIVPANRKVLPAGTFRSILNQAGLSLEEFKKHL
ncbi:MAG: type II toxin-antitoxin system HicA family toxin [Bacteroidota bacterium]|nr:type II toxin-antitoxin system HicA family toxin [Bacteroidota bacterium]MDP4232804.1 type II toxin-antitoxin system HicA family toxin [Bacteroidota bacterium]MDP4242515.1 type II toxin-antitoxin system HicA family toxin [Bacteroidota bacterium]MDP4289210.1 type II toxin-antitoxin system HicA family toxin [Bacteroidota bacterium]